MSLTEHTRHVRPVGSFSFFVPILLLILFFSGVPGVAGTNGFLMTGSEGYSYTPDGAVWNSSIRTYVYDRNARLQEIVASNSLVYSSVSLYFATNYLQTNAFIYDAKGNLLSSATGSSETTIYTNVNDHETEELTLRDQNGDGMVDWISNTIYTYDDRDRLIRIVMTNDYNAVGVADSWSVVTFTFDASGHRTGFLQEIDFNSDGVIDKRIRTVYTLDDKGRAVAGVEDFLDASGALTGTWNLSYAYDKFGNLTEGAVDYGHGIKNGGAEFRYSYEHRGEVIRSAPRVRPKNELAGVAFWSWDR